MAQGVSIFQGEQYSNRCPCCFSAAVSCLSARSHMVFVTTVVTINFWCWNVISIKHAQPASAFLCMLCYIRYDRTLVTLRKKYCNFSPLLSRSSCWDSSRTINVITKPQQYRHKMYPSSFLRMVSSLNVLTNFYPGAKIGMWYSSEHCTGNVEQAKDWRQAMKCSIYYLTVDEKPQFQDLYVQQLERQREGICH